MDGVCRKSGRRRLLNKQTKLMEGFSKIIKSLFHRICGLPGSDLISGFRRAGLNSIGACRIIWANVEINQATTCGACCAVYCSD